MRRFLLIIASACLFINVFGTPAKKIKVACIGDSITYGAAIEDREHFAYPVQLQALLGGNYLVGNFGHNGATLLKKGHNPYDKLEVCKQAINFAADVYVIHLGVNDTDPRDWPNYRDDFVGDYLDLINSFRGANPSARIIIALLSPLADRHLQAHCHQGG